MAQAGRWIAGSVQDLVGQVVTGLHVEGVRSAPTCHVLWRHPGAGTVLADALDEVAGAVEEGLFEVLRVSGLPMSRSYGEVIAEDAMAPKRGSELPERLPLIAIDKQDTVRCHLCEPRSVKLAVAGDGTRIGRPAV